MTDPTSPLMGMPVLDVPLPHRIEAKPQPARVRPESAAPPRVALPSAKKTIVGGADDLPTPEAAPLNAPKIRPAVQKTILGTAPPVAEAASAASMPAKKTIVGTGFEDEGLRPTVPEIPMAAPSPAAASEPRDATRTSNSAKSFTPRPSVEPEPLDVPTTSTSPAFWMLVVAICAVIAGIVYTL